jgi:hypothetical protein
LVVVSGFIKALWQFVIATPKVKVQRVLYHGYGLSTDNGKHFYGITVDQPVLDIDFSLKGIYAGGVLTDIRRGEINETGLLASC